MTTGWVLVPTTLEFSSTAEWLSIDTVASCERTTAPWARTVPAPIQAGPSSTAESAMTGAGTSGHARLKLTAHLQALRVDHSIPTDAAGRNPGPGRRAQPA